MIVRKVTQVGDPSIRRKSKPVRNLFSKETRKIIRDLIDSMPAYNLIGMAAPQIGKNSRIFAVGIRKTKYRTPEEMSGLRIFINPKITRLSRKKIYIWEGCGSVGNSGVFARVRRPESLTVTAFDEKGRRFKLNAGGLLSRVIQHEFDHLEGRIFLDGDFDKKSLMSKDEYYSMVIKSRRDR